MPVIIYKLHILLINIVLLFIIDGLVNLPMGKWISVYFAHKKYVWYNINWLISDLLRNMCQSTTAFYITNTSLC